MKKHVLILLILLSLFGLFAAEFSVGPIVQYVPVQPSIATKENIFRTDSYKFGVQLSFDHSYFCIDENIVLLDVTSENFYLSFDSFFSHKTRFYNPFSLSLGIGTHMAVEMVDKLYFTVGGCRLDYLIDSVKNRPELLFHIIRFKFDYEYKLFDHYHIKISYLVLPYRLGKNLEDGNLFQILDTGGLTFSFQYKF